MLTTGYQARGVASAVGVRRAGIRVHGAVAVQVIVMLSLLLGFTALAIDSGYLYVSTAEMQRAVDSGALAGASVLRQGALPAEAEASTYATGHAVAGQLLGIGPSSVVSATAGNWDGLGQAFVPLDGTEIVLPNAVRVDGHRNSVGLFLASILGIQTSNVTRDAVAALGSGRCLGIWGLDSISGNGNIYTDSYDSREGLYGEDNIYANGDICSAGDISLSGSAVDIYGDAMYGQAGTLATAGQPAVWGITGPLCCPVDPPTVDTTDAMLTNDNDLIGLTDDGRDPLPGGSGSLRLAGTDNLTLVPGTYYFTSVRMTGLATLTITGPTEIWVSGNADFTGGGLINVGQNPADLKIYSTGPSLTIGGNAEFYGAVIAPETDIVLGGTPGYYGVFLGQNLDIHGEASIHVDESVVEDIFGVSSVSPVLVE